MMPVVPDAGDAIETVIVTFAGRFRIHMRSLFSSTYWERQTFDRRAWILAFLTRN